MPLWKTRRGASCTKTKLMYKTVFTVVFCIAAMLGNKTKAAGSRIDSIVVLKQRHEMRVYGHHSLLKIYKVALGEPVGAKQFRGDWRTPEGMYFINVKNLHSAYHKSMGISYPSAKDRARAQQYHKDPGGNIMIHGLPNGQGYIGAAHRLKDWTAGCIAVTDEEIDELFTRVEVGTRVNILP